VSSAGWLDLHDGPKLSCCNSGTATNFSCLVLLQLVVVGLLDLHVNPIVAAEEDGFLSSIAVAVTVFMSKGFAAAD